MLLEVQKMCFLIFLSLFLSCAHILQASRPQAQASKPPSQAELTAMSKKIQGTLAKPLPLETQIFRCRLKHDECSNLASSLIRCINSQEEIKTKSNFIAAIKELIEQRNKIVADASPVELVAHRVFLLTVEDSIDYFPGAFGLKLSSSDPMLPSIGLIGSFESKSLAIIPSASVP